MGELTAEMVEQGRGATFDRARRRRLAQDMRAAREKLTSSSGLERAFDYHLAHSYAANHSQAAIVVMALAAVVAGTATYWVPPIHVVGWFIVVACVIGLRHASVDQFLKSDAETLNLGSWRQRFVVLEIAFACAWIPAIQVISGIEQGKNAFAFFVVLIVAAVTAMLSAPIPFAVYAGMAPLLIAVGGVSAIGHDLGGSMLAVMTASAFVFLIVLSNRLHESTITSLQWRSEKDRMLLELEEAKANSDEARRRAEEANLAKSRFLATMSHELRTPLNAIMGFSEVMKNEVFGAHAFPAYRGYSQDIHESGQHLLTLIDEILDLSRIEAGRYELAEEALQLAWVVSEATHMVGLRAKAKGQTIHETIDSSLPRIWSDERAVRQIVLNILSNAIKFTPSGGEIVVKVGWTSSGGQYLSVKDTGPGIPEEEIPIVLSSFGRGSLAIKTAEQGSGLGLPIVKGLVDLHGGGFQIRSRAREGTEVIVTFPAIRVMDTLAAIHLDQAKPRAA